MNIRLARLITLAALLCGGLSLGSQPVAHADAEPTPRPVMLPTVTPEVAPAPMQAPVPAPVQSRPAPDAGSTPGRPTPEPTPRPNSAQPARPSRPHPTSTAGFEIDNSPAPAPATSSLPLPSIDDAADEVASQIEVRIQQASRAVSTIRQTIDYTNIVVLLIIAVAVGVIVGLLVLTIGRLVWTVRRTSKAARDAREWQGRMQARASAPTDQRIDPDTAAVVLCKLVSDTIGRVVVPANNELAQVGDEPVPHLVVLATDGRAYILTSDVAAMRRGNLFGGRVRTWHIANPQSFSFTRAQALWDRALNLYALQSTRAKPMSSWHIAMVASAAWQPSRSSMPQHAT